MCIRDSGCNPDGNSLTGSFQNTNIPNTISIRDITQETTGLRILKSVINIYFLIGLIFPFGFTFFRPSATIRSPTFNPEITSINPSSLFPIWI